MRRTSLLAAVLLSTALPLAAGSTPALAANTTLGEASANGAASPVGGSGATVFQNVAGPDVAGAPSYTVPAGGGVITGWTVILDGSTAPTPIALEVGRPEDGAYVIDGSDARTAPAGTTTFSVSDARIPVQAGSQLGVWSSTPGVLTVAASGANVQASQTGNATTTAPTPGSVIATGTIDAVKDKLLQVSAVLEPDADGDGFGDTTQDECPSDSAAQLAPCPAHVATSTSVSSTTTKSGGSLSVSTTLNVTGTQAATGLVLHESTSSGLAILKLTSSLGGSCESVTSCTIGTVTPGQTLVVTAQLYVKAAGEQSVTSTFTSAQQPLLDNPQITQLLAIEQGKASSPVVICRVPQLVGKTTKDAKAALSKAHCGVGTIKVAKLKRGQTRAQQRVLTQNHKKGQLLAKGTKVTFTVGIKKK